MPRALWSAILVVLAGVISHGPTALAKEWYSVDTESSRVKWAGKKIIGTGHHGTIRLKLGRVQLENGKPISGHFVIDMNSIENEDVSSDSNRARLVNHLKSDDFFSVSTHPTASFDLESATAREGNNWIFAGKLTIKGITHPIEFPGTLVIKDGKATANAALSFDRARYDVRYNSGKFFDPKALGDNLINDQIDIELKIIATHQPEAKGSTEIKGKKKVSKS